MARSRVIVALLTIPRLSGATSRKGRHVQTLSHQKGIHATLGHTRLVPLLPRHSVGQVGGASVSQVDLETPDIRIMEDSVALVDYNLLISSRGSFQQLLVLLVGLLLGYYLLGMEGERLLGL